MNEWNKLSMADRAAYIKLGIDNGITDLATIRDTYNKFAEGGYYDNKTIEVTLPEIVVTPSEVQKEYKLKVRPFLDKKAALDIGKSFDYLPKQSLDSQMKAFIDIHQYAGKPHLKGIQSPILSITTGNGDPRAYYNPIFNTAYNINSLRDAMEEMSHPIQLKLSKKPTAEIFDYVKDVVTGKQLKSYNKKGSLEYNTHRVVQPLLNKYLLQKYKKENHNIGTLEDLLTQGYNKFDEGGYVREQNNNPIAFDKEGNLVDQVTGEKGTMMLPEFTVRGVSPETKAKNYSSAYHPEDALEFLDIMTKPITAPITPSLQVGAIRNALNGRSYYKSLMGIEPNLGITTENFNKEHPYLSMGANLTFDVLSPFVLKGLNRGVNAASTFVGKKYVTPYLSSRILNNSIKANPKGQILVSDSYFNSPNNWYRISNTPEVYGIKEIGKNVTTRDSGALIDVPSDNWRTSVLGQPLIRDKEGFLALDPQRDFVEFSGWDNFNADKPNFSPRLFQKSGSAHGNRTQAAKGQIWKGGLSNSSMFPTIVIEGEAAQQIPMGLSRTNFKLSPWEDIPMGHRIGFKTGEMPMENLGYFQDLKNGKYSYQGQIIPDKRIDITPKINISPEEVNVQYTKKYPKYLDESGESIVYDDGSYVIKEKSLYDDNSTLKKLHYNVSRDLAMNKIPGIQPIEYLGYKRNYNPQEVVDGLTGYRMTKLNKSYDPVYRQKKITTLDNTYFYPNNNKPSPYQLLDINNIKHDLDFGYVNGVKFSDFGLKNWGIDSFGRYRLFDPMIEEF